MNKNYILCSNSNNIFRQINEIFFKDVSHILFVCGIYNFFDIKPSNIIQNCFKFTLGTIMRFAM